MQADCGNIYLSARKAAGLTQERWAEMLGISYSCVRQYESDLCLPSDAVVAKMAEVSGMTVLGYWHLKLKSSIANDLLPELDLVPLPQATVTLLSELNDLEEQGIIPKLLQIAKDGIVSDAERPYFEGILKELDEVVRAAMSVKYAKGAEHG